MAKKNKNVNAESAKGDIKWVDPEKKDAAEFVPSAEGELEASQLPVTDPVIYSAGVDPCSTDGCSQGASLDDALGAQEATTAPAEDDATAEAPTTEEIQSVEIDEASRRLAAKNAAIALKEASHKKQFSLLLERAVSDTIALFKKIGVEVEVESDCVDGVRYVIIVKQ